MSDMEDWQLQSIKDSTVPSAYSEDDRQAHVCASCEVWWGIQAAGS